MYDVMKHNEDLMKLWCEYAYTVKQRVNLTRRDREIWNMMRNIYEYVEKELKLFGIFSASNMLEIISDIIIAVDDEGIDVTNVPDLNLQFKSQVDVKIAESFVIQSRKMTVVFIEKALR